MSGPREASFETADGQDICRTSVDSSDHPVYDTKAGEHHLPVARTPVSSDRVADETELDHIVAHRSPS